MDEPRTPPIHNLEASGAGAPLSSKAVPESNITGLRTQLVEAAQNGDSAAWHQLVEMHHRLVWWALASYRFDQATAEDVYQTVWCRLAENLDKLRNPEALAAWLVTTTRNEALRQQRNAHRERPAEVSDAPDLQLLPDERAELSEEHRMVREGFWKLDDDCRHLLTLLLMEPQLTYEEICEQWGRPVGSIGPTRARCLQRLRELMR